MKVFILCGGSGTRLDQEGKTKSKTMVKIGPEPILMHILNNFCKQGFNEFVLCLGYKHETVIDFFLKLKRRSSKIIFKKKNHIKINFKFKKMIADIDFVYTGKDSGTGGRIKKAFKQLKLNEDILMTYGDGLSDININSLVKFHYKKKSLITISAVRPKQRYGILKINSDRRVYFFDNTNEDNINIFINGGFHVIDKNTIKKIKNNKTYWEQEPMNFFLKKKKLFAFKYFGFWKSLDTIKDKNDFNQLYYSGKKLWIFKNEN